MTAHRWPCSVPGCHCTVTMSEPHIWPGSWALCRKHWPTVPLAYRKALRHAKRRHSAIQARIIAQGDDLDFRSTLLAPEDRARRAFDRLQRRVLRYAIERATGIA